MTKSEYNRKYYLEHLDRYINKRRKGNYKSSDAYKGVRAEKLATKILGAKNLNDNRRRQKDYDLLWNNKKINVKSAHRLQKRKGSCRIWCFSLKGKCDYYFCIAYKQNKPIKYFLIPSEDVKKYKAISISTKNSKYNKYLFMPR